jgi:hypothetical protein
MVKWLAALFRLAFPDRESFLPPKADPPAPIPNGNVVQLKAKAARRRKVGKDVTRLDEQ